MIVAIVCLSACCEHKKEVNILSTPSIASTVSLPKGTYCLVSNGRGHYKILDSANHILGRGDVDGELGWTFGLGCYEYIFTDSNQAKRALESYLDQGSAAYHCIHKLP